MSTFNKIINKVVKLDNNIFSLKHDNSDNISGIHKIFFGMLENDVFKIYKNKFYFIQESMNNFYFSKQENEKEIFFNLFCKIQTIYHTLNRFVYLCKYKKSKLIVDNDLQLNKIKENELNVICIYHINSKYLFKIEDLLKIIYMSLTNNFSFFSEPISIKNPYNNIPFGKSILYFIYTYLVLNAKIMFINPDYLDIFFKFKGCNFNMTKFLNNYEYVLREYSLKNYLNNSTKQNVLDDIKLIVDSFNSNFFKQYNKIKIDEEFPQDELIKIMKPYLYLYLVSIYSLVQKNRIDAKKQLYTKMREFQRFNPQFGKKTIRLKDIVKNGKIKKVKSHIDFDMKCKKFNTYEIETFMTNHLSYKYESYEFEEGEQETQAEIPLIFSFYPNSEIHTQPQLNTNPNEDEESKENNEPKEDEQEDEQEQEA